MSNKDLDELEKELSLWGIDPRKSQEHKDFYKKYIDHLEDVLAGAYDDYQENYPQKLTAHDPLASMKEVYKQEIGALLKKTNGLRVVTDQLKIKCGQVPVTPLFFDRSSGRYVLHRDLANKRVTMEDIDPLERFSFKRVPAHEKVYKDYVDGDHGTDVSCRAIVAHYACKDNVLCVKCNKPSIYYNGYGGQIDTFRYWKKLICDNCGSVYEIKSAMDTKGVHKKLSRGNIRGGNFFAQYFAVQNSLPKSARQYVAIIPQATDYNLGDGKKFWPVYVSEVVDVLPQLRDRSFDTDGDCKIFTYIVPRKGDYRLWFKAPAFDFDGASIAREILDAQEEEQVG
jgi:hypothetical protein